MNVIFRLFLDCSRKESAHLVIKRLIKKLSIALFSKEVSPYHKGGFICSLNLKLANNCYEHNVIFIISKAQEIGYSYTITGSIEDELNLWSSRSKISGVKTIEIILEKPIT